MSDEFYAWLVVNFPGWESVFKYENDYSDYKDTLGIIYDWYNHSSKELR